MAKSIAQFCQLPIQTPNFVFDSERAPRALGVKCFNSTDLEGVSPFSQSNPTSPKSLIMQSIGKGSPLLQKEYQKGPVSGVPEESAVCDLPFPLYNSAFCCNLFPTRIFLLQCKFLLRTTKKIRHSQIGIK